MIQTLKSIKVTTSRGDRLVYAAVGVLWLIYIGTNLLTSNNLATMRYHISESTLDLIAVVFSLPILFIWLAIAFAVISFYHYAQNIAGSKDSRAFRYIAYGLLTILGGSLGTTLLGSVQNVMGQIVADPSSLQTPFVIIRNYISVVAAILTYGYLFRGSTELLKIINAEPSKWRRAVPVFVVFAGLSLLYLYLVFTNGWRQTAASPGFAPTFGLPDSLILLTVVVPYLVSWFLGVFALRNIIYYQSQTAGIIYKKIFKKLASGMSIVISLTIVMQIISQFSGFWASSGLGVVLGIIIVLYLILVVAYVLIARGARELHKIEIVGRS